MSNAQEFQTWLQRGAPLVQNHKQAKWALGEWLLEVDAAQAAGSLSGNWWPHQPNHHPYSEWVRTAAQHYGYKYDTFLQFKRVAVAFPPATRVAALSWHHHQAVAAIDDPKVRAEWLSNAELREWPAKELQARVSVTKHGLSVQEALQVASLAAALNIDNNQVQVLILRDFLQQDTTEFIRKHAKEPAPTDDDVVVGSAEAWAAAEPKDEVVSAVECWPVIPTIGALPTVDVYNSYLARGKKFTLEVLAPGGMEASKGTTATAKLKKYFLVSTGKTDLKEITVLQWEALWARLDAIAKDGNEQAAAEVEAKSTNEYSL